MSNTFPEPGQAIHTLWRLQLPPKELTRVISFMHEDVQKDTFKLTMAELQRVVRLTLVPTDIRKTGRRKFETNANCAEAHGRTSKRSPAELR